MEVLTTWTMDIIVTGRNTGCHAVIIDKKNTFEWTNEATTCYKMTQICYTVSRSMTQSRDYFLKILSKKIAVGLNSINSKTLEIHILPKDALKNHIRRPVINSTECFF